MNLQESIRRILREELSPRVRRRIAPDEMEKDFLESFDYAYKSKKRAEVLPTDFLDELIYSTITILLDGLHWYFVTTLPEDEFWYDDIHAELENHYRDRIIQMYNERDGINESILREETKLPTFFRRRVTLNKVRDILKINAEQVYYETESYRGFKFDLTLRAVEAIMYNEYGLGWEDLPEQEEIEFVTEVSNILEKDIKTLFNQYKKR